MTRLCDAGVLVKAASSRMTPSVYRLPLEGGATDTHRPGEVGLGQPDEIAA
jgi:hypothetical protein